jgi:hypothetical protein
MPEFKRATAEDGETLRELYSEFPDLDQAGLTDETCRSALMHAEGMVNALVADEDTDGEQDGGDDLECSVHDDDGGSRQAGHSREPCRNESGPHCLIKDLIEAEPDEECDETITKDYRSVMRKFIHGNILSILLD